jgi:hypothetical protein
MGKGVSNFCPIPSARFGHLRFYLECRSLEAEQDHFFHPDASGLSIVGTWVDAIILHADSFGSVVGASWLHQLPTFATGLRTFLPPLLALMSLLLPTRHYSDSFPPLPLDAFVVHGEPVVY